MWLVAVGVASVVLSLGAAIIVGPAGIGWADLMSILVRGPQTGDLEASIVWELRLPRAVTAAAVGAGLALAGAVMQATTRNALADPYILGLSSGASLGAVAVIVLGWGLLLPVAAFAGALLALAATLALAGYRGASSPARTVLAGVAVSAIFASLTSFVIFWSTTGDSYREILGWLLGTLGGADWTTATISGVALVTLGGAILLSGRALDAFAFGDRYAASLGVDVRRTRITMLVVTALLTGAMVSVSGAIGFIGLVIPHAIRLVAGSGHRLLLPLTALYGAAFLTLADTLARTVFEPRELPVGVITALIGAPAFAMLLSRRQPVGRGVGS